MGGVVIGLLLVVGGGAVIYFHQQLYKMFGDVQWAEKAFGDSRVVYPLVGAGMIVLGILFMFGVTGTANPTDIDGGFGGE